MEARGREEIYANFNGNARVCELLYEVIFRRQRAVGEKREGKFVGERG